MKLYTREQMIEAFNYGQNPKGFDWIGDMIDSLTPIQLPSDEELAILFHNKYESLAPKFNYETKIETRKFNKDSDNGKLMIAVCKEVLQYLIKNK